MARAPVVGDGRRPRSGGLWTLALLGILVAAMFSALTPARAHPPSVDLYAPDGGEALAGGSLFTIAWNMSHGTDPILFTQLDLSTDGGATFLPIASGDFPAYYATYDWTVPAIDTSTARVRVCATGGDGNQSCDVSAGYFVIDSTPPYIVYTVPADGATNVPLDQAIFIQFSEPVNPSSFSFTWIPAMPFYIVRPNATAVYLYHNASFTPCTSHTITVYARDLAGNSLVAGPAPNPWTFTTTCGPSPYIVSTSPADGATEVSQTTDVLVTFSEPMNRSSMLYTFWWSDPAQTRFNYSWSANDTVLTFTHADPFAACIVINAGIDANDTDGNPLVPGPVPNPLSWTTTCGNPVILSTDPPDQAVDIVRTIAVVVTFSEAMTPNATSVQFTPTVGNVNYVWTGPSVLRVLHDPFDACAFYVVQVTGTDVEGNALVPGPVPNPWSFMTDCGVSAIVLSSPVGGESWTGGRNHAILFRIVNGESVDHAFSVAITFTYASGASGGSVGSVSVNVPSRSSSMHSFPWIVPTVDATDVIVNVTARDGNLTVSDESGPFEIDSTAPQVLAATPSGPRTALDPTVTVVFSEPMAIPPRDPLSVGSPQGPPTWTTRWNTGGDRFDAPLAGTVPCTTYDASVGIVTPLFDDSDPGNSLTPLSWTFTTMCLPSVTLLAPNGGEDWTGGSLHTISWTLSDQDSPTLLADLSYSSDGGATFVAITTGLVAAAGPDSYPWTVPKIDSAQVSVRIDVVDPEGNAASDASDAPLTIDSTPPALLTSYPSDGATGFRTTREIWFVFTERVDHASFQSAFSIYPDPGGLYFSWSMSNLDTDVLMVDHAPLMSRTAYVVTFGTAARDDSDPGNSVPSALQVRFSTQPPPNVNPPVAKAVGKNQVLVGEPVTLDGTGSTGSITSYVWRIVDNQGRFVAVLVGPIATYAFRDHGRHSVTLIVTDQNGLTGEDTIEITVTSNENANGLILGGALLAAALLIGSTEAGRLSLFAWILFPLYVRRKRNELLEHQTRGMILGYVMVHPGDTYTDIKRNLMLTNGTLSYHLVVMEREGLVRSQIRGTRKLFFPEGVRVPEDGGGLHEVQVRMHRAIQAVPGLAVKDIAGALGITSQHALYHLRELAAQGYVRLERRGLSLRCFAEPGKGPALHEESGQESD